MTATGLQPGPGGGLVLSGVSKSYMTDRGPVLALPRTDLAIPRGRFVTLVGPSGCGKSTLLRVMAGVEKPDEGIVSVLGEDVAEARRSKHIGFVPQELALLPWRSVIDNVRLPLQINRAGGATVAQAEQYRAAAAVLSALGLGQALHRRPSELSGGMRQRVAIARAFLHQPRVLLMDEPFSALDELTSEVLRQELLQLWESSTTTVVFVSHSLTEAVLLADEVVVMGRDGVRATIDIGLPRPRPDLIEETEEFRAIERDVRLALRRAGRPVGP